MEELLILEFLKNNNILLGLAGFKIIITNLVLCTSLVICDTSYPAHPRRIIFRYYNNLYPWTAAWVLNRETRALTSVHKAKWSTDNLIWHFITSCIASHCTTCAASADKTMEVIDYKTMIILTEHLNYNTIAIATIFIWCDHGVSDVVMQ